MSKKKDLINAAIRLFADQGFDGTSTIQLSREAGVTEPLIYYHFRGKDDLFTHILKTSFDQYFLRLAAVSQPGDTQFEKLERLLSLHMDIIREMPREVYLIASACPSKFKDPENVCTKNIKKQREWLKGFVTECLEKGIETGEFVKVPVAKTVSLIISLITGLIRQQDLYSGGIEEMKAVAVDFCRRSLVA